MGGNNSGRVSLGLHKPVVEDAPALAITELKRLRCLRPSGRAEVPWQGGTVGVESLCFVWTPIEAYLSRGGVLKELREYTLAVEDVPCVLVRFKARRVPTGPWPSRWVRIEKRVEIEWTVCPRGRKRPWWRCPRCRGRCGKLYWVNAELLCRRCGGLGYSSQYEGGRLQRRAAYRRGKLGL